MNCVRTFVGKTYDALQGYNGLIDCIGKAAADRMAKLVARWDILRLIRRVVGGYPKSYV